MKQPEVWKPIRGYEGLYEVSNYGRVKSFKWNSNGKILSPAKNNKGYYFVSLSKDGKAKGHTIHRLVAEAFIQNPSNLPQVNHKDEDKRNNHVTNLEWCTPGYNITYGTRMERISKPVVQLDKEGNLVAEYKSTKEASRVTGIPQSNICKCCQHKYGRNSAGGFIWIYKDEYTQTQHDQ